MTIFPNTGISRLKRRHTPPKNPAGKEDKRPTHSRKKKKKLQKRCYFLKKVQIKKLRAKPPAGRTDGSFDTLTDHPCAGAVPSRHSCRRSCRVAPNIGGCGPKPPMSGTADQVSLHIECVVDRGMHRPEPLSR